MTPEQKIEFIDGEVVLHSPVRNLHLSVTQRVSAILGLYEQANLDALRQLLGN